MRPFLVLIGLFLLSTAGLRAAEALSEHSYSGTRTKAVGYRYLLSLPKGYDAATGRRWPLMLFLHGAGERGSDVWLVAKHGPPKLLHAQTALSEGETAARTLLAEGFIVVAPQCRPGESWDDDALLGLLDQVAADLRVDAARVYLTGLSMGGFGTWSLGVRHPERFAAIVPICGGGQTIDLLLATPERKQALQSLGVWAFHGAKDPTVAPDESERMVAIMKRIGVKDLQLFVYPEARHDSWTETYASPELYAWLLRHQR